MIHTSDWHLGRMFHQVGLLDAQARWLDHLVDVVRTEKVDAVLVAGDVYDRALPAPDTVRLLSQTCERLVDAGAQVILSSGNHDSAIRLGFASGLLERSGLHIRTSVEEIGRPVLIGDIAIHPLPYLEPSLTAGALGASERTHSAVLRAAMERVRAAQESAPARHTVVMAHAFAAGGAETDSERDLVVGGSASVPVSTFTGVSYAALGHLHRRQQLRPHVRYSGSPVAMSFSEADHHKGSLLLDLAGDSVGVSEIDSPTERGLSVLRGHLEDLLCDPRHAAAETSWCQVTLTDPTRPLGAMERLRRRFPHTLEVRFDPEGAVVDTRSYSARTRQRSDLDVCCDFLAHVRGGAAADEAERELMAQALEASRVARGVADDEGIATVASGAAGAA